MICEMCGAERRTKFMMVEGAPMHVCQDCEKFAVKDVVETGKGDVVTTPVAERLAKRERRRTQRDIFRDRDEFVLRSDYGNFIRHARRKKGMSQDDLAKKLGEKKSVLVKVENQDMRPSDALIAKLEKTLGVSLKEDLDDDTPGGGKEKEAYTPSLTLGDFIKYE